MGSSLVPVAAAHQQGSPGPPEGGMGQQRYFGITGEKKTPHKTQQDVPWLQIKMGSRSQHDPGNSNLTPLGLRAGLKHPGQHPHVSIGEPDL